MKNLDWGNLSFGYMKTDYNVRCYYRDGKWGEIEVAFEGLKAYRCKDGKVRVFRMEENAARLQSTCRGIMMPEVSTELFCEMVKKVVRLNQEWIPTYESGATLSFAITTVQRLLALVNTRSVVTMPLPSSPTIWLTKKGMPASSILTPRRRSTSTSVVLLTSSVSRTIHISRQSQPLSYPLSLISR